MCKRINFITFKGINKQSHSKKTSVTVSYRWWSQKVSIQYRAFKQEALQYLRGLFSELNCRSTMRVCITFATILALGVSAAFAKICGEQSNEELRGNICTLNLPFFST